MSLRAACHLLCIFLAALGGCAAQQRAATRTGGIELAMYARSDDAAESFYEIKTSGTLSFGGGMDARLEKTSWTGQMTDEEIAKLRAVLEQHHWLEPRPKTPKDYPDEDQRAYRVTLTAPGLMKSFRIRGEHEALQQLRELFEQIALRRLEPDLQRLPQPSVREQPPTATAPHSAEASD